MDLISRLIFVMQEKCHLDLVYTSLSLSPLIYVQRRRQWRATEASKLKGEQCGTVILKQAFVLQSVQKKDPPPFITDFKRYCASDNTGSIMYNH